jgi:hypothetical protein
MRNRLLAFGGFAQIPQGILAGVYGLALVCIELLLNTFALELSVARLTDAKNGHAVGSYYDPELAFGHTIGQGERNACRNQMALTQFASVACLPEGPQL